MTQAHLDLGRPTTPTTGVAVQCPACQSPGRTLAYAGLSTKVYTRVPGTWQMWRCQSCGSLYLDPGPDRATLRQAYTAYYTHRSDDASGTTPPPADPPPVTAAQRFRRGLRNGYLNARFGLRLPDPHPLGRWAFPAMPLVRGRADRWARHVRRPREGATLLEVGCGSGDFLDFASRAGWVVAGLDTDEQAVGIARGRGLDVTAGELTDLTFAGRQFDAVVLTHVLEHVPDPVALLARCGRLLAPGGQLSIATPNVDSVGHRRFARDWVHLDPPRHFAIFTLAGLARCLSRAGLGQPRLRRVAGVCEFSFVLSSAIRDGHDTASPPPLRWRDRLARSCAEGFEYAFPSRSEELFVTAGRPGQGPEGRT